MMLNEEIPERCGIPQAVAQRCTTSPTSFRVWIHDLTIAIMAVKQELRVGGGTASGLLILADHCAGIPEKPTEMLKHYSLLLRYKSS